MVVQGEPSAVPLVTDGIIGQPGTRCSWAVRTAGYAPSDEWGIEGSFFYILPRSTETGVSSSGQIGSTDLIVPFFDVTTNRENGTELSFSPIYRGSATEKLKNSLLGAELNATWAVVPDGPVRVELLGGFRYLRLRETYTFKTSSPFIPAVSPGHLEHQGRVRRDQQFLWTPAWGTWPLRAGQAQPRRRRERRVSALQGRAGAGMSAHDTVTTSATTSTARGA